MVDSNESMKHSPSEREILDLLLSSADPRDLDDARAILDGGIRIRVEPLYHVGAAYNLRDRKLLRVNAAIPSALERAALVVHEMVHLRQGIPRCFLLAAEVEAWQRQWRFLRNRTGRWWWEGRTGVEDAILFEEFMRLPSDPRKYAVPHGVRLRMLHRAWRIRFDPRRTEEEIPAAGGSPLEVEFLNDYADGARHAMKRVDPGYLAYLLFPWPSGWLFHRGFWQDVREGFARVRRK